MSTLSIPSREGSATPTANRLPRPSSSLANRPRWNASTNTSDIGTGHNFKPLTLTTPSPYAKRSPTPVRSNSGLTPSSTSKLPTLRTPLSRGASTSPIAEHTPSKSGPLLSFRERLASPPDNQQQQQQQHHTFNRPRLTSQPSAPATLTGNRRASLQPPKPIDLSPPTATTPRRPASSLASSRRTSLLPQPRTTSDSASTRQPPARGGVTGRESPQAVAGARFAMRKGSSSSSSSSAAAAAARAAAREKDSRPRWRG